jgi:hypothetical protein
MLKIDIAVSSASQVMLTYGMCFPLSPLEARHITDDKLIWHVFSVVSARGTTHHG